MPSPTGSHRSQQRSPYRAIPMAASAGFSQAQNVQHFGGQYQYPPHPLSGSQGELEMRQHYMPQHQSLAALDSQFQQRSIPVYQGPYQSRPSGYLVPMQPMTASTNGQPPVPLPSSYARQPNPFSQATAYARNLSPGYGTYSVFQGPPYPHSQPQYFSQPSATEYRPVQMQSPALGQYNPSRQLDVNQRMTNQRPASNLGSNAAGKSTAVSEALDLDILLNGKGSKGRQRAPRRTFDTDADLEDYEPDIKQVQRREQRPRLSRHAAAPEKPRVTHFFLAQ